jgi:threonine dehydrogenase-like Zn-dependent dehydrogenase
MGHESSGRIVEGHTELAPGTPVVIFPLVSCGVCRACRSGIPHVCETLRLVGIDSDGGMATLASLPSANVMPIPATLDLKKAAFIEPLAVGVHAVRRSGYQAGDSAIVYGAGPIGMSVAMCLRYFGASSIVLIEGSPFRRQVAESLGFMTTEPSAGLAERIRNLTGETEADICFDCAAHPSVQESILSLLRVQGTMVVVGSYKAPAAVDLLRIEFRELTILGTRVYSRDDFRNAIRLIASGTVDPSPLLFTFRPEEAPEVFGKGMVERGTGKIINIASLLSFQGGLTVPAYAAAKGAVAQFTKSLSNEWAGKGVNVNAIAPGYMDTEMNTALKADPVRSRQIMDRIPAGRWGRPEDMVGALVYLASKASDYVNGSILVVDGGWMGR